MFKISTNNQVHQISFLQLTQIKVHDFNTLLVQETDHNHSVFSDWGHADQKGVSPPRETITAQHLTGTDWIRSWIIFVGMATNSCWSSGNVCQDVHSATNTFARLIPNVFDSVSIWGHGSQGRIWTLLLARNCVVWHAALGLALCWNTAPCNVWCPK